MPRRKEVEGSTSYRTISKRNAARTDATCGPLWKDACGVSFLLIKDDAAGFRFAYFLREKSQAAERIIEFIAFIETQTGRKVTTLRSDCGTEFVNKTLHAYITEKGIVHETSSPYSPQSNGKIEKPFCPKFNNKKIKCRAKGTLYPLVLPKAAWHDFSLTSPIIIADRVWVEFRT
jgi:transposase InsO family protein